MARNPAIAGAEVERVIVGAATPAGSAAGRATDWGAIIGGALGAIAISIILFTAGSGFGLSTVEPWSFANRAPETFAKGAAIWLVVMQWLSAGFGGYLVHLALAPTPKLVAADPSLEDVPLMKNMRLYRNVDDMDYLKRLDTPEMFGDEGE